MKFAKSQNAPSLRSPLSTQRMMNDIVICMVILSVIAVATQWYLSGTAAGLQALILIAIAATTAMLTEWGLLILKGERCSLVEMIRSYPVISGLMVALLLPIGTPLWVVIIGTMVAIIAGKFAYGGLGKNIFNPALVGRVFVTVAFGGLLTTTLTGVSDSVSMATPLTHLASLQNIGTQSQIIDVYGMSNLWLGLYPTALGEGMSVVIILMAIYLIIRKTIDWRIPVVMIGTVFVMTYFLGIENNMGLWYPTYHVITGGLLFGAVFMATDLVTTPVSRSGRIIFAVGAGVLTVTIRIVGGMPEGVAWSILAMNALTPVIDHFTLGRIRFNVISTRMVAVMATIGLLVVTMTFYVGATAKTAKADAQAKELKRQQMLLKKAERQVQILSERPSATGIVYEVQTKGFTGDFIVYVEIDTQTNTVNNVEVLEHKESMGYGQDVIESDFMQAFDGQAVDSIQVDTVSGATITSEAIIKAVDKAVNAFEGE
ncbi:MAG: RnfABCDGE type electron transport complex subunit D [Culicoidibacterales bacterium]